MTLSALAVVTLSGVALLVSQHLVRRPPSLLHDSGHLDVVLQADG